MNRLLYLALSVGTINGFCWQNLPKGSYYILNSFFVLLILSFSTLLDEVFFDNTIISINELLIAILIPFFWVYKRKNETNTIK